MLARLLESLHGQETDGLFSFSIVVVDNDDRQSARETVAQIQENSPIHISYDVEPEQNISLARNKALKIAEGDYLAGIDDDEFADRRWLAALYQTITKSGADGVLGPVVPCFETPPPSWVVRGGIFERQSFPTGTVIKNPKYTRCGNFLISKRIVRENEDLFNPELGRTGGEDVDFFNRMIEKNYNFVWSQEATVYETVPAARLKRAYVLKRALLRGVVRANQVSLLSPESLKSLVAFLFYTPALPFLFLFRRHLFMRYLVKDCDHIGKLLALCGIDTVRERPAG